MFGQYLCPVRNSQAIERERFYNKELPYCADCLPFNMIVGGDFSCVPNQTDSTGKFNYSKTFDGLVRGFSYRSCGVRTP